MREKLKSFFKEVEENQLMNGTVLIAKDNTILFKGAFGEAEIQPKRLLNETSIFNLASVSKPITAIGIILLVQSKQISFDDDIGQWFPQLPYKNITIRHLLHHTSGLPDFLDLFKNHWDKRKIADNQDVLDLLIQYQPERLFESNERMEYSNTGYVMLALIIEKVTGLSFSEYMKKEIFQPLNMHHTEVYTQRLTEEQLENYAYGYIFDVYQYKYVLPDHFPETTFVTYLDGIVGDGAIHSTIDDLYLLDRVLRNGEWIHDDLLKEAYTPAKPKHGGPFTYGFGWILEEDADKGRCVLHSGGWPGYATHYRRYLDQDIVMIFLRNKEQDFEFEQLIIKAVENIIFDAPYEIPKKPTFNKAIKLPIDDLKKYVGMYELMEHPNATIEISMEEDRLMLQMPSTMKLEMHASSKNEFFLRGLSVSAHFSEKELEIYLSIDTGNGIQTAKKI